MKRVVLVLCLVAVMGVPTGAPAGLVCPPHNAYQTRIRERVGYSGVLEWRSKQGAEVTLRAAEP